MPFDHEALAARREKLGLTQQQAADAAGIHRVQYNRIEGGRIDDPGVNTVEKLAAALKVPISKLMKRPGG